MAKEYFYKIITDIEKLSDRADEVDGALEPKVVKSYIKRVKTAMKQHKDFVALCGPQVGLNARVICLRFAKGQIKTFINPMITKSEGLHFSRETNASLDGEFIMLRHDKICVLYQNENGGIEENKFEGMPCEVFEQMYQMLDGILLTDIALPIDEEFDKATEEERQELLDFYVNHLKDQDESLAKEIESNKELRDIKGAIDFMTAMVKGDIDVVPVDKEGNLHFEESSKAEVEKLDNYEKERLGKIVDKIKAAEARAAEKAEN